MKIALVADTTRTFINVLPLTFVQQFDTMDTPYLFQAFVNCPKVFWILAFSLSNPMVLALLYQGPLYPLEAV